LFIGFVIWQILEWSPFLLPPASSDHGSQIDTLMQFTMGLILTVFFILTPVLFFFVYKYRGRTNNTAYYYTHNNKLEIIWTVIPTIVLTGVIIFGLKTWDKAMNVDTTDAQVIEVYAKQFNWTARYSGTDNTLGSANYRLVKGTNALGVDMEDPTAADDKITREVHLVSNKPVLLKFRSQDVIHSAYLPHFRVQMNCVPGMTTQFAFTPTQTTQEMKQQEGEDFEYILLCNKICGSAHYNMQMKFIVETQEEYNTWLASQKTLSEKLLTQN
jgi:cytochrome c oxidase subunit 2